MRKEPNQRTPTLVTLRMSITMGNTSANSRPERSAVSANAALASANRASSDLSRTKARTTRIPVNCSRKIRFTASMRVCMDWKMGNIRTMIRPTATSNRGTLTAISHDNSTS